MAAAGVSDIARQYGSLVLSPARGHHIGLGTCDPVPLRWPAAACCTPATSHRKDGLEGCPKRSGDANVFPSCAGE